MLTLAAADTLAGVAQTASKVTCTIMGMELAAGVEAYKCLDQRQLAAAAGTIYTVPASTQAFVRSIAVINTDAANTQTFQLFRGGTAAANAITPILILAAGGAAYYEDGRGWTMFDNLGQLLQRAALSPILSAVLVADTANQVSTTEAIVGPVLTVPANFCNVGTTFYFDLAFSAAQGAVAQTTPGILFQIRWGGLAGVVIASVGTITPATLLAALPGRLNGFMTIRTIGATGTAKAGMVVDDPRGTRVTAGDMASKAGMSAAGTGVVIDTTVAKDLVITCKTTAADAAGITFGTGGFIVMERP